MLECPKCGKPLDVYYEPTTESWAQDGVVAFPASCSCGWRGEACYDLEFRNLWDAETGDFVKED